MALAIPETTSRIRRETDAALINAIANDPSVKPDFGYNPDVMDFAEVFGDPEHYIVLSNGHSVVSLFEWSAPGVWQQHFAALPHARGAPAINAAKQMADYLFKHHEARMIWAMAPTDRPEVATLAYLAGYHDEGETEDVTNRAVRLMVRERANAGPA
jgi:hypothetical protein